MISKAAEDLDEVSKLKHDDIGLIENSKPKRATASEYIRQEVEKILSVYLDNAQNAYLSGTFEQGQGNVRLGELEGISKGDSLPWTESELEERSSVVTPQLPLVIEINHPDQRYLEQLISEVLYAQKAYGMAVAYMRKKYEAPDSVWALNNIEAGFERVGNAE